MTNETEPTGRTDGSDSTKELDGKQGGKLKKKKKKKKRRSKDVVHSWRGVDEQSPRGGLEKRVKKSCQVL